MTVCKNGKEATPHARRVAPIAKRAASARTRAIAPANSKIKNGNIPARAATSNAASRTALHIAQRYISSLLSPYVSRDHRQIRQCRQKIGNISGNIFGNISGNVSLVSTPSLHTGDHNPIKNQNTGKNGKHSGNEIGNPIGNLTGNDSGNILNRSGDSWCHVGVIASLTLASPAWYIYRNMHLRTVSCSAIRSTRCDRQRWPYTLGGPGVAETPRSGRFSYLIPTQPGRPVIIMCTAAARCKRCEGKGR